MRDWVPKRDQYLNQMYAHEAPRLSSCASCKLSGLDTVAWRCTDCFHTPQFCKPCLVKSHVHQPFHRLEHWSGKHYERVDAHEVGIELYLGHEGAHCPHYLHSARNVPGKCIGIYHPYSTNPLTLIIVSGGIGCRAGQG